MKWFSLLAVIVSIVNVGFPPGGAATSLQPVVIKSISHSKELQAQESITFKLDAAAEPNIFFIPGKKPRLVLDFPQSVYLGKNVIPLSESILASAIRIGRHQKPIEKTRAVIDLSPKMGVHYATEYKAREHTLIVTLTPDSAKPQPNSPPSLKATRQKIFFSPEDIPEKAPATNAFSLPASARESAKDSGADKVVAAAAPTILEISFDDSSDSREMVLIRVNGFYPPAVRAIENDTPRVLCDFTTMAFTPEISEDIQPDGRYVRRIYTTGQQDPEKVQVVLELLPGLNYDLHQVFYRNDNLFVLMVNELPPGHGGE